MKKISDVILKFTGKIKSFYLSKSTGTKIAIGALSAAVVVGVAAASIFLVSSFVKSGSKSVSAESAVKTAVTENKTLETEETKETEETSTEPVTEETTTVDTEPETQTEVETIPIEKINISHEDLSTREEIKEKEQEAVVDESTINTTTLNEYACVVKGIDISKWNTVTDWDAVRNSGVHFVIIRCGARKQTSGALFEDAKFREHMDGALAAGLQVGVYFYSQAINEYEALEEASYVLSLIKDYKFSYPVCFDWEPVQGCRLKDANLSKDQYASIAKVFLSTIKAAGYDAMFYSYSSAIDSYMNIDALSGYKIWLAYYFKKYNGTNVQYTPGDEIPDKNYNYQMWQYSSSGTVPGIIGRVDMNVGFFSYTGENNASNPLQLNIGTKHFETNAGMKINLRSGITAKSITGKDISSQITYTITDNVGKTVSEDSCFNTPGTYTINYSIKDFTGSVKKDQSLLTVRKNPEILLKSDNLIFDLNNNPYDAMDAESFVNTVIDTVKSNIDKVVISEGDIVPASDVTIEGCDLFYEKSDVDESESGNQENTGYKILPGTYTVTYRYTDKKNAVGTKTLTFTIEAKKIPENQEETSSQSQDESQPEPQSEEPAEN